MDYTWLTRWPFLLANLPLILLFGYAVFGSWQGLGQSIVYAFIPNWISALAGEHVDDIWSSLKLWFFLIAVILLLHGEYPFLLEHFPGLLAPAAPAP